MGWRELLGGVPECSQGSCMDGSALSTHVGSPQVPERPVRRHILSVVLEDYCHVAPVSRVVPPDYWSRFESRVHRNTELTLDLLDEVGAKATFFVLGWIGEHQPEVVAEVARRGHEIASKGYFHRSIRDLSPQQFREDVRRSRDALENRGQCSATRISYTARRFRRE